MDVTAVDHVFPPESENVIVGVPDATYCPAAIATTIDPAGGEKLAVVNVPGAAVLVATGGADASSVIATAHHRLAAR